jgi:hypothetical protein
MNCRRRLGRRKFLPFLEGVLPEGEARRLEAHLAGCASCRSALARVKAGHDAAERLASRGSETAPPSSSVEAILAGAASGSGANRRRAGRRLRWSLAFSTPRAVQILVAVVIVQAALLAYFGRDAIFNRRSESPSVRAGLDVSLFKTLDIADLPINTHPHVATEGYVRDVWMDAEEKTLHFKLAAIPEGPSPYVVCEILSQDRIAAPRAGSRVRVYGVARYDAQVGRQWHEVNPVLDIAVLKK